MPSLSNIGHLGTTVIGHSLKKLHEFAGYKCVGINYLGDWGTQFGKLIVAYRRWGNREMIEQGGVDKLVELYVKVNNAISGNEEQGMTVGGHNPGYDLDESGLPYGTAAYVAAGLGFLNSDEIVENEGNDDLRKKNIDEMYAFTSSVIPPHLDALQK